MPGPDANFRSPAAKRLLNAAAQAVDIARSGTKPTNPKDGLGIRKVPFLSVISLRVLSEIALGMLEGALKYRRHNYREAGVRASVYVDAAGRHLAQFWEGQDIDPESKAGLHHVSKAIASLTVLRDSIIKGNWTDDRPPRSPDGWIDADNKIAGALVDAFPNAPEPHTQLNSPSGA